MHRLCKEVNKKYCELISFVYRMKGFVCMTRKKINILLMSLCLLVFILFSNSASAQKDDTLSFFTIGHPYGAPSSFGDYPATSLLLNIDFLMQQDPDFVMFLGDLARGGKPYEFELMVDLFVKKITPEVHNAIGNHDSINRVNYQKLFTKKSYYSFTKKSTLFVVLDTESSKEMIDEKQFDFFKTQLNEALDDDKIQNIFVFSHKLMWLGASDDFGKMTRYTHDPKGHVRAAEWYKVNVVPLLSKLNKKNLYWVGGDVGCMTPSNVYVKHAGLNNIHYFASGICDQIDDGIIKFVIKDGKVKFYFEELLNQKVTEVVTPSFDTWVIQTEEMSLERLSLNRKFDKFIRHIYSHVGFVLGAVSTVLTLIFGWFIFRKKASS
jgi:hypothetical protein